MKQSDIYKLHKKYSTNEKMLEIGWNHSLIIRNISLQIADNLEKKYGIKTDKKLIETGALIHDIGFYAYFDKKYQKIKDNYVEHGIVGYKTLKKENFSEHESRFALTHVGIGYKNYFPITLEEEIVAYADNFHSKGHPSFDTFGEIVEEMKKHNPNAEVILNRLKDKFGIPDLKQLKKQYKKWHKEINEWIDSVK